MKFEEEVGDREVQFIEKRLNTGRKTLVAYMDWKYQYNCKERKATGWMSFACVAGLQQKSSPDRCRAHLTVRQTREGEGVVYRAEKLTGGPHNHGEMRERVMVDYAKHRLKLLITQGKEWRQKSLRQIYVDFVDSFPADMDEENKSLFSVVFPSFQAMELPMRRWKKSIQEMKL